MKPGHWLGSALCVSFSALTLCLGLRGGHPAYNKSYDVYPKGFLLEILRKKIKEEPTIQGF